MTATTETKPKPTDDRSIFVDDGTVYDPPTYLDPADRAIYADHIARVGHSVVGGCAGFRKDRMIISHTIGLSERGLPELAISGFQGEDAMILLNLFSSLMTEPIPPGEDALFCEDFMNGYAAMARPLPTVEANQTVGIRARLYYGHDVPIWQLIPESKERRWPWQDGCSEQYRTGQNFLVDWRLIGPPRE